MRKPRPPYSYRRSIRLRNYDYRQEGAYFVTICTYRHAKLFGTIIDGQMLANDLGETVRQQWEYMSKARSNVLLDHFVVMPNHLHGVIVIEVAQKNGSSTTVKSGSLGAIVGQFKAAVTRWAKAHGLDEGYPVWQRNYYERIVRDEKSLNRFRQYIIENPARWELDSLYVH